MEFALLYEVQGTHELGGDDNRLYKETIEQCVLADKLGFHSVWFVEHHFLKGFSSSPSPDLLMSALSQKTKKIRLGFGVSILPHHHPIRIAERVAMLDQLSDGRVEFGSGRGSAYEQTGTGVDPRKAKAMWEESLNMITSAWQSEEEFSWEGKFWSQLPRHVVPKPYQKPHPPLWMACLSPESYRLTAANGLGVLSSTSFTPHILEGHIQDYRKHIQYAEPIGSSINNNWANHVVALCGDDDGAVKRLCVESLKAFFGPDKPYVRGRIEIYERLIEAWGGVPDDLKREFGRWLSRSNEEHQKAAVEVGIDIDSAPGSAQMIFSKMDAETLCERGVIIAGDPESCIKSAKKYEEIGVDLLILMMQTESVSHETVMKSIEMFGSKVLPSFGVDSSH